MASCGSTGCRVRGEEVVFLNAKQSLWRHLFPRFLSSLSSLFQVEVHAQGYTASDSCRTGDICVTSKAACGHSSHSDAHHIREDNAALVEMEYNRVGGSRAICTPRLPQPLHYLCFSLAHTAPGCLYSHHPTLSPGEKFNLCIFIVAAHTSPVPHESFISLFLSLSLSYPLVTYATRAGSAPQVRNDDEKKQGNQQRFAMLGW
ncbi:unnamed protein product [Pleuronectes platessa]|uniref:Uncharacterized protein n=1 Tax=Pleuronectes platessa TaxID=8262 RepID=A0A9N7Z7R3_PLEPL|nr:unnamed protein product [Pleuronectes platessa]